MNDSLFSSASPEWYTPPWLVELVRRVMGGIHLDPCAPDVPDDQQPVRGCREYLKECGQSLNYTVGGIDYGCNVYMNPPYGREIGKFIGHLCYEYTRLCDMQAVALLPARTDTEWWGMLAGRPVCFLRGRVKFIGPSGEGTSAPFPSALVHWGDDEQTRRFLAAVKDYGRCYVPA